MEKTSIEFPYPINIGSWASYQPYSNHEQIMDQLEAMIRIPLENQYGKIGFIYSKEINELNTYLESLQNQIKIEDTETILETEVYYTSKIEGANTTLKRTSEIHNGLPININNEYSESMIKGNFEAVKLANLYGNQINCSNLYQIWNVLTYKCKDNIDLQESLFRKKPVYVGSYEGAKAENLPKLMKQWICFYNSDDYNEKPFVKAALLHYGFETIHPFCDGNGRLGRLLINNYLISRGIETARAVSFSMQVDKARAKYDVAFIDSENVQNDCTPFIHYMLSTFANAYTTALEVQKDSQKISNLDIEQINDKVME